MQHPRILACALLLVAASACSSRSENVSAGDAQPGLESSTTTRRWPCPGEPGYSAGFGGAASQIGHQLAHPGSLWGEVTEPAEWPEGLVAVEEELLGPDIDGRKPGSDASRTHEPQAEVAAVANAVRNASPSTRILMKVRGGGGLIAIIDGPDVEFLMRCPVAEDDYFYESLDQLVAHDPNDDYRTRTDAFLALINQDRQTGDIWILSEQLLSYTPTTIDRGQAWEEAGPMDRSAVPIADPLPLDVAASLTPGTLVLDLPDAWQTIGDDDTPFCTRNPHGFNPCKRLSSESNYPGPDEPPTDLSFFFVTGQPVEVYLGGASDPDRILLGSFVPDEHADPRNITLAFTTEAHETTTRAEVAALAARGPLIETR